MKAKTKKELLTIEEFIDKYSIDEFNRLADSFNCSSSKRVNDEETCKNLNEFLANKSVPYAENNFSETYLFVQNDIEKSKLKLIAYCAIQTGSQKVIRKFKDKIRGNNDELNDFYKANKDIANIEVYSDIEITNFAVNGSYQKQGYGIVLMFLMFQKVYEISQKIGCSILVISEPVETAFEFYKSLSFIQCETLNPRGGNLALPTKELPELIKAYTEFVNSLLNSY